MWQAAAAGLLPAHDRLHGGGARLGRGIDQAKRLPGVAETLLATGPVAIEDLVGGQRAVGERKGAAVEKKKGGKASATRSKSKGRKSSASPARTGKASAGKGGKASVGKGGKASAGKGGKGAAKGSPSRSKSKGKGKEETKSTKKGKKVEKEDEIGKPTRALSAYIFYSNETIPKLKAEEGIAHKDAMGKAGQIWNTLTDDKKKKFNEMHDADVMR